MTSFKLPLGLCKRIQSALTRFWWDSDPEKRKLCWVAWTDLARSKMKGGIGFREIQRFNEALLAKTSWRLLKNPETLLAKTLLGKYCFEQNLLTVVPLNNSSHGWRSVIAGRDLLRKNIGKAIGNGMETNLWTDQWLISDKKNLIMGPPTAETANWTVAKLMHEGSGEWNIELVKELFPLVWKYIMCITPSKTGTKDEFFWMGMKDGKYTSKSGYHSAMEETETSQQLGNEFNCVKEVWDLKTAPKIKMFIWKAAKGALPTGMNLVRRKVILTGKCPNFDESETTNHCIFKCGIAKEVWRLAPLSRLIQAAENEEDFKSLLLRAKHSHNLPPTGLTIPMFPWICWGIWNARNRKIFEDKDTTPQEIIREATIRATEWNNAQIDQGEMKTTYENQTSQTPKGHGNEITCFTDAAWHKGEFKAGLGWIFELGAGNTFRQRNQAKEFINSPLMAEATAMLEALKDARHLNILNLRVASDSASLIAAINERKPQPECFGLVSDIINMSIGFNRCIFQFVPRLENKKADDLAKRALRQSETSAVIV